MAVERMSPVEIRLCLFSCSFQPYFLYFGFASDGFAENWMAEEERGLDGLQGICKSLSAQMMIDRHSNM